MTDHSILPHLFRTEYQKVVAVLAKYYGLQQLSEAEDIASETFLTAAEMWGQKGVPDNPVAWLYLVAKNKAKDRLKHLGVIRKNLGVNDSLKEDPVDPDLTPENIFDSQLQMIFAICHPIVPQDSQTALALRILCGFGIDEIADAFLSNPDTINKRLYRAKEILRKSGMEIEFPEPKEIPRRLDSVIKVIYLLFNEGYYSGGGNTVIKKDMCLEAMRLAYFLTENESTNQPKVNALMALICFHSSRFEARTDAEGEIIRYEDQDRQLWNQELISKGIYYLNKSSCGAQISKYHLEATIAYEHTRPNDPTNKWENILQLYNQLLILEYSPMAALNRIYALSMARGKKEAIQEAQKIELTNHHLYHVLMGFLYKDISPAESKKYLEVALMLANNDAEKRQISKDLFKLGKMDNKNTCT